ncbi:MAG: beta-glucosidase BglX [Bacteroidia bacterium]|nr:beta-glucosidase BglX [Bacteroidia bacterium]
MMKLTINLSLPVHSNMLRMVFSVLFFCGFAASQQGAFAQSSLERRVDSVLALMTLEEKVGQMNQYTSSWDITGPMPKGSRDSLKYTQIRSGQVGSMLNVLSAKATREAQRMAVEESRLGIPLIFGYDVIHGFRTMFPIPLGEAASWDMEAIEKSSRVAASEAAAAGQHWTFAPMLDITRDARWGRMMESAGEDPYLGSLIATARVRGFQGDDLSAPNTIAACAKHFAAYGLAEGGRDYNTVSVGDALLHDAILPPFKAAADAGVATFMNAFNEINGIPATASNYLQRKLLKGDWDFPGFIVSDWGSVAELIPHGVAANEKEAARIAAIAGCDMDMEGYCYVPYLVQLVKEGAVEESMINDAVRRILRVKFMLGLFDDPYRYCDPVREQNELFSQANQDASREVARKSVVLLKNQGNILPLKKDQGTIAVIGPLAADKDIPIGSWRGNAVENSAVSLLEGIKAAVGKNVTVRHAQGVKLSTGPRSFLTEVHVNETDTTGFGEAVRIAKGADVVVMALGEDCWQSGEGRSRTEIDLPGLQTELLAAVRAVNPRVVLVLMNGRPLDLSAVEPQVQGLVEAWFLGSQSGNALADVLFGDYNPSGKLPVSFPRSVGQVPLYYNHKSTGRPTGGEIVFWSHYSDEKNDALFPFGYGLSYTTFSYSALKLSSETMRMNEPLKVSFTLTNTGKVTGTETAQLYTRDLVGSRTRPVIELKKFQKVTLKPGESRVITLELTSGDLAFFTREGLWQAEAGDFEVMIGPDSRNIAAKQGFKLVR